MFQGRRGNQDPDEEFEDEEFEEFKDAQEGPELEPEPELDSEHEIEPRIVSGEHHLPDQVLMGNIIPNIPDQDYNMNIPQSNIIMAEPLETQRDTRDGNMIEYSTVRKRLLKLDKDLKKCLEENARLKTDLFSVRDGAEDRDWRLARALMVRRNRASEFPGVSSIQRTKGWIILKGASAYTGQGEEMVRYKPAYEGRYRVKGYYGPYDSIRRKRMDIVKKLNLIAFSERNENSSDLKSWWPRDQTKDPDEMLLNSPREMHTDTNIAEGVNIDLLVAKSQEGFTIFFENEGDRRLFLERGGILRGAEWKKDPRVGGGILRSSMKSKKSKKSIKTKKKKKPKKTKKKRKTTKNRRK